MAHHVWTSDPVIPHSLGQALPLQRLSTPSGRESPLATAGAVPLLQAPSGFLPPLPSKSEQAQPQTAPRHGFALTPARNYPVIDVGVAAKGICVKALWSFSNSLDLLNSLVGAG